MSRIRGGDTGPERAVRRLLHNDGYRFRLHRRDLPGKPDVVLPRHRKVVFVNGCFWHGHKRCARSSLPATNVDFWKRKVEGNVRRDAKVQRRLRSLGWRVLVVWQCQTRDEESLLHRLRRFMGSGREGRK